MIKKRPLFYQKKSTQESFSLWKIKTKQLQSKSIRIKRSCIKKNATPPLL